MTHRRLNYTIVTTPGHMTPTPCEGCNEGIMVPWGPYATPEPDPGAADVVKEDR